MHSAMLGMFNGMTALKKNRFGKPAKPAETVGVLGAGLMGAGVAQVTAQKAKDRVLLKDLNQAGLSRGIQQVEGNLATALKRRKMDMFTKNTTMSRIVGLTEDDPTWPKQFEKCDLVVEAVLEELSLKHRVIEQVEQCEWMSCLVLSCLVLSCLVFSSLVFSSLLVSDVFPPPPFPPLPPPPLPNRPPRARDLRDQHVCAPHPRRGQGEQAPAERARHALLLPRRQDASAGDHQARGDV